MNMFTYRLPYDEASGFLLIYGVIGSMTVSKTVGSGSSPDGSAMHEWRNLEDAPDLGSDAEMHVSSVSAPAPVRAKPTSTGRRAPHLVYCSMYLERKNNGRFRNQRKS